MTCVRWRSAAEVADETLYTQSRRHQQQQPSDAVQMQRMELVIITFSCTQLQDTAVWVLCRSVNYDRRIDQALLLPQR